MDEIQLGILLHFYLKEFTLDGHSNTAARMSRDLVSLEISILANLCGVLGCKAPVYHCIS